MSKDNENDLSNNIKQSLDDSVDALDANTLSRIRQLRARAVEKAEGRRRNWSGILLGGLATTCVMVLALVLLLNNNTLVQPAVPAEDLELISSSDDLELFEDLEFYEWLVEDDLPS